MNLSFGFIDAKVVNGQRVKQAREQALMTQVDLARAIGVSQPMIAHIEQGLKQASSDLAERIAEVTRVKGEFLYRSSGPALSYGSMLFRARADVSARKFAQTHAIATNIFEMYLHMAERFELPPVSLRPISVTSPEDAAVATRKMLGLDSSSPIPHLMRALEKAGGILLALPELKGREAFAVWGAGRPTVGVAPSQSGDRLRFSTSHEIGHLILHNAPTAKAQAEREAHRFAAELLMPREAIVHDLSHGLTFEELGRLKRKWGVAMSALLYRAKELRSITKRQHDRLVMQMSAFRIQEPAEYAVPKEQPRGLRQMAEVLYGDELKESTLAQELALSRTFVHDVIGRYASEKDIAASTQRRKVVPIEGRMRPSMVGKVVLPTKQSSVLRTFRRLS